MIHKSHSKKDLINIIKVFKLSVEIINKKKDDIVKDISNEIFTEKDMDIDMSNDYLIKCKNDLVYYLTHVNPKKILSVKDKKVVILKCKKLKHYCLNGYSIQSSETYRTIWRHSQRKKSN